MRSDRAALNPINVHSRLADGTAVCLRTITPEDEPLLRQGLATLSAEARYLRFFSSAPVLPDPVIDRLLAGRAHQVVLTKGGEGATIITTDQRLEIPACPAKMIDSNGAGDAFSVALWHGQKSGLDLLQAGRFAAAAAALAIEDASLFPAQITAADISARAALGEPAQ